MAALDPGAANDAARRQGRGRRIVGRVGQSVTVAVAAATSLAAFARAHWVADLATHFPWQYAAAALAAGAALAWVRRPVWALVAVALFALNAYDAHEAPSPAPVVARGSQPFRVLVCNVFYANSEHERVIALVRAVQPDAAVFVEVNRPWDQALRALEADLPHSSAASGRRHGVLLLSRWPIRQEETVTLAPGGDPFVHARLDVNGRPLELIGVHAAWPLGPANSRIRNRQLANLATLAASMPKPLLIAGDLNASPYSPHVADLLAGGGLRLAAGRGWTPTWPTFFLPAGIQIDHVLVSGDVAVKRFGTGPAVGSDHLPLIADLLF